MHKYLQTALTPSPSLLLPRLIVLLQSNQPIPPTDLTQAYEFDPSTSLHRLLLFKRAQQIKSLSSTHPQILHRQVDSPHLNQYFLSLKQQIAISLAQRQVRRRLYIALGICLIALLVLLFIKYGVHIKKILLGVMYVLIPKK